MYLALKTAHSGTPHYVLRESRRQGEIFIASDLAELGPHPGRFIVYNDGGSFHLDEDLIALLRSQGVQASDNELEDLFLPFIDPYIRQRLQPFRMRSRYRSRQPANSQLLQRALVETHFMDRRRLCFLRLGRISAESVDKTPVLYTSLLDKSRDEIEQLVLQQEQALPPRDLPVYLFSIFDLQRFFHQSYARSIPQALDRERLDALFLQELCALAADTSFWQGFPRNGRLPAYLLRYLLMYFDAPQDEPQVFTRFSRSRGFRQRRSNTQTGRTASLSRQEALALFALSGEELAKLRRQDLTRLYRKKAGECHPDKGGSSEAFILLTAAYEALLPSLR